MEGQVNENYRFVEHADVDMEPREERIVVERSISSPTSSLAAKAIRASSAHRDSSLSSAYSSPSSASPEELKPHEFASTKSLNDPKRSFWGTLARKAKAILDDDGVYQLSRSPTRTIQSVPSLTPGNKKAIDTGRKTESPSLQRSLDAIASSLNYIGGTIGSVVEEGFTAVENHTAGIIQETRRHIKKKPSSSGTRVTRSGAVKQTEMLNQQKTQMQADLEIQLKASRDVAMAMAAKAKLLLRELKTVKADLAFAKQRCTQLEEENKVLREGRIRGDNPDDDDLIRLQLETLLAEKARLAHENSIYARENRFLREVVEYHQLTMQDVVYLDEKTEEVTEVYPIRVAAMSDKTSIAGIPNISRRSSPPEITEIPRTCSCDSSNSSPPNMTSEGAKMRP